MTDRLVNAETLAAGTCPVCGQKFSPQGLAIHRGIKHKTVKSAADLRLDAYLDGFDKGYAKGLAAIPPDPRLDALLAAARDIAGGGWIDEDGETGNEWCHWCKTMPDYPRGKPVERHRDGCEFVALRAALAAFEEKA